MRGNDGGGTIVNARSPPLSSAELSSMSVPGEVRSADW
jgi:hypothetical protein